MNAEVAKLFDDLPDAPMGERIERAKARARVLMPNRLQLELRPSDLESLLPEGHRARIVWGYVERQDLSAMYAPIKAVEGGAGRTAIAPEILYALWLYATLEGVGHARALERLTQSHDAYRWICGGVQVNYHTLSDFRAAHGEALDGLLTDGVASLMAAGAVKLKRVAQDGMRVRASAGAGSFRRQGRLESCLAQAREQVAALRKQVEEDPGAMSRRSQAARERAVREREERIKKALERLPELARIKQKQGKDGGEARASTTDARATVMKMGDGGFRPAYNAQYATDSESQVIVGVDVVTSGSDLAQMAPMVEQVSERCGRPRRNGWSMAVTRHTSNSMQWLHRPRCMRRCKNPRTRRSIPTPRRQPTARRWPPGASAWAPMRPRRSTRSAPPLPNASMRRPATAG
jgi:transposase